MILELINLLPDPRMAGKVKHDLSTVIFVTLCGILSGCESWTDIEHYCEIKKEWLEQYVEGTVIYGSACFARVTMKDISIFRKVAVIYPAFY